MKLRKSNYFDCEECKPFFHQGGEIGVVLLHGFTGSIAHMRPLGDALHACGYTVMGVNLPGHATTEADMARYGRQEWLQAALDAVEHMRLHCSVVAVCGLSMGAILSLILAENKKADACISISAPMPSDNKLLPFARIASYIVPRVSWKEDMSRTKLLNQQYDKGYPGFPLRKAADLHRLIKQAQCKLRQITCPTLVIQSTGDTTVSQTSIDTIYQNIGSTKKLKLLLEDVPHVCTISKALPRITETIDSFLRSLKP